MFCGRTRFLHTRLRVHLDEIEFLFEWNDTASSECFTEAFKVGPHNLSFPPDSLGEAKPCQQASIDLGHEIPTPYHGKRGIGEANLQIWTSAQEMDSRSPHTSHPLQIGLHIVLMQMKNPRFGAEDDPKPLLCKPVPQLLVLKGSIWKRRVKLIFYKPSPLEREIA